MPSLPTPGGDAGVWGTELNTWLTTSHNADGSAKDSAYQFRPESYGAKRDGKFLYDAHMTGTTAVLTTAGLPAPSAPTVSNSGTGGTVAAGVYQVQVTYVNQFGETLASSASSTTTSGTTSKITVNSPLPWTNATAYYVYCTQAGGSTFTRQQSLGSPTALRTQYVITAPPSSGGAAPPGANTSNSAPFTAGDVGKNIVVPSAGGFLNVPLVTTIASFQSSTQVTLTAASTSAVTGYGALYGTDDTSAVQQAINAAVTFAQTAGTEQALGEVLFSDGIYCIAGAPVVGGATAGNAQITLPAVNPYTGPKVNLALTGTQEATGPVHWEQPNPPASGTVLACMRYTDSFNPTTNGPQSVIGGPVGQTGYGGPDGLWSNMRVVVDGLNVLVAYRPSYAGLDLFAVSHADIKSFSYYGMARTGTAAGGWPPYTGGTSNPAGWQVFGYRCPGTGNNDQNDVSRMTVYGAYYGFLFTDHFAAVSVKCIYCYAAAVAVVPNGQNAHHCWIGSLSSEATSRPLLYPVDGTYAGVTGVSQPVTISSLHSENADFIIDDADNLLYGEVRAEQLNLTGPVAGGKSGAANITLVWPLQALGHVASPPAVPLTTVALTNQFWRPATVAVHTGVGVTVSAVTLDGTASGLTLAASSSLAVPVRNGGTIALTYAGGTPTWDWWLG